MKYGHIVTEVFRKPWAILPEKLDVITALVALRASGGKLSAEEIKARLDEAALTAGPRGNAQQSYGAVAVIPIRGVISHRANLMSEMSGPGGTSIEKLTSQFRAALADASVKAIVFDVDSPGGSVAGVMELADEIYQSRKQKKSIAVANGMAASAAYWLASAAGELVVIPSGEVGSIGVYCAHQDISEALKQEGVKVTLISAGKFKVDGSDIEPLSDSARADMQSKVDDFYGMFVKAVGLGRKTSQDDVRGGFGQGRMVLAKASVKEGMADRVATLDDVLKGLGASDANPARMAAESSAVEIRVANSNGCACACEACSGAGDCANCSNETRTSAAAAKKTESLHATERRRRELAKFRAKNGTVILIN